MKQGPHKRMHGMVQENHLKANIKLRIFDSKGSSLVISVEHEYDEHLIEKKYI